MAGAGLPIRLSWSRRCCAELLDGGVARLLGEQLKRFAGDVEPAALDEPLVIGPADREQGRGVEQAVGVSAAPWLLRRSAPRSSASDSSYAPRSAAAMMLIVWARNRTTGDGVPADFKTRSAAGSASANRLLAIARRNRTS